MLKVINELKPTKGLVRHIAGFAEQTRQERCAKPEVSEKEAAAIFQSREQNINYPFVKYGIPIRAVHSNMLPSNDPTEDRRMSCVSRGGDGHAFMTGVFDGHAGPHCAQAVAERLFYYTYFANCSNDEIKTMLDKYHKKRPLPNNPNFFRTANDPHLGRSFINPQFVQKLMNFGEVLLDEKANRKPNSGENLYLAALQLDQDILEEAMSPDAELFNIRAAIEGCVACWTYITESQMYVGNTGDAAAIIVQNLNGNWRPVKMSTLHSGQNEREVTRILHSHPREERTVLRNNRLLGCLSPLRAFGDCRFKLTFDELNDLEGKLFEIHQGEMNDKLVLPFYRSPPYLTAAPQIRYHRLGLSDRALVLASDGLWDVLGQTDVAQLVGQYIEGDIDVYEPNCASMLIRRAIGEGWDGYDPLEVRRSLAIPPGQSRDYRDDITVQVIFF